MRGYPKHINTRRDLDEALRIDDARAKAWLREALENREGWRVAARLDDPEDGVEDEMHRIVAVDPEDGGVTEHYQEDWGPLPGNALARIGLTVEEAEALLE